MFMPLLDLSSPGGHLTHRVPVQANMALTGQWSYLDLLTILFLTGRNEPIALQGPWGATAARAIEVDSCDATMSTGHWQFFYGP